MADGLATNGVSGDDLYGYDELDDLSQWISGLKDGDGDEEVAISGSPTPWRVEPQGKIPEGETRAPYYNLRRWITVGVKEDGKPDRRRETRYIGSWNQAVSVYPTECKTYKPKSKKKRSS